MDDGRGGLVAVICKGTSIIFELADGETIRPPASYGLLHKGDNARVLYCGPFSKGPVVEASEVPLEAREYLGKSHRVHRGSVGALPKGPWESCGEVAVLYYRRGGTRAPGKFRHRFGKSGLAKLFLGNGKATLSKCGRWYRLNLPRGARVDSRGIVWP